MNKEIPPAFQRYLRAESGLDPTGEEARGVTFRSLLVGVLLSLFVGIGAAYVKLMIGGTSPAHNFSTPIALFGFFVFVAGINATLGLLRKSLALRRGELATVYIMAMIAAAIPTIGFTSYVLPVISGVYYYATPENDWVQLLHPHIPRWMVPARTRP